MSNKQSIRIPKTSVVQAGNTLGIKPNRMAMYLGLDESKEKQKPEKQWEAILPVLLEPLNFLGVMVLFEDDSLLLTNVLTSEDKAVFCGSEEDDLVVLPMEAMEMVEHLASYLGQTGQSRRIKQVLSSDALIAMLMIADSLKRMKLKNILDPKATEFEISLKSISKEFEDTVAAKDLRWLAPFIYELRWEAKPIDFDKALNSLATLGIIQYKNKLIEMDDKGIVLFDELHHRKSMIGIRSAFYHEGTLNYLSVALLRTENFLWQLDVTEEACMMSLNIEELKGMIATMLAPGDDPGASLPTSHVVPQEPSALKPPPFSGNKLHLSEQPNMNNLNQWQCICGRKNTGNFCSKCGSEKPTSVAVQNNALAQPTFCGQCGAAIPYGARFCRNCGAEAGK